MITIIVAIAANGAIGKDNDLLWHIPGDLRRFKELTTGHCLLMGRNTWYSLPKRPLPNRQNIVLTDDPCECLEGCESAFSIEDSIQKCGEGKEIFVIGGGMIYKQFMSRADRLMITYVHKDFEADTFFPAIDPKVWEETDREDRGPDEKNDFSYSYVTYHRRK
jgi:dihydrofolate reductase